MYCFHLTLTEIWRNPCRCRLGSSFLRVLTGSDRDMTRGVRGANCARAKDVWQTSRVSADVTTDTTPLQITECTGRRLTICSCYRLTSCICRNMTHCTCRRCYDMKPMLCFRYVQIRNCGLTVLVVFDSSCYSAQVPQTFFSCLLCIYETANYNSGLTRLDKLSFLFDRVICCATEYRVTTSQTCPAHSRLCSVTK